MREALDQFRERHVGPDSRAEAALGVLRAEIWPGLDQHEVQPSMSKTERERLLGYGSGGA